MRLVIILALVALPMFSVSAEEALSAVGHNDAPILQVSIQQLDEEAAGLHSDLNFDDMDADLSLQYQVQDDEFDSSLENELVEADENKIIGEEETAATVSSIENL